MSQAIVKNINLQEKLDTATTETQEMMHQGIDISDPTLVTPLESIANQYPEVADACNQLLIELVQQQTTEFSHQEDSQIVHEF